jgi:hypothetical protein
MSTDQCLSPPPARLIFPPEALVGSLGHWSRELARNSEVPEEFYYASGLTLLGSICGADLQLSVGFDLEPRLYTVLLGDSYAAKKSTALKNTIRFFEAVQAPRKPRVHYGVGSAEGLARALQDDSYVLLAYDELRALVDKTKVQGSVLLPMVTGLFEQNKWDNITKSPRNSMHVDDGHLSILGCCTTATFSDMWTPDAISIGFPNRLFVVNADRTQKVAWPKPPDEQVLERLRVRIQQQIARLPLKLSITHDGMVAWEQWYNMLPASEHSRRLDTIGFRLLGLIALITDKDEVDLETVNTVTAIQKYVLNVRILTDPIDADNTISRLEEKIRRALGARGPLSRRELRRLTHADRAGLWAFEAAVKNLISALDVQYQSGVFRLVQAG